MAKKGISSDQKLRKRRLHPIGIFLLVLALLDLGLCLYAHFLRNPDILYFFFCLFSYFGFFIFAFWSAFYKKASLLVRGLKFIGTLLLLAFCSCLNYALISDKVLDVQLVNDHFMFPNLLMNDFIFFGRSQVREPRPGEVVAFRMAGTSLCEISRVMGFHGDQVRFTSTNFINGKIAPKRSFCPLQLSDYENYQIVQESYGNKRYCITVQNKLSSVEPSQIWQEKTVEEDYFVLKDNRLEQGDSRYATNDHHSKNDFVGHVLGKAHLSLSLLRLGKEISDSFKIDW